MSKGCVGGSDPIYKTILAICLTTIASFLTDQGQKQTEPPYFYFNQAELDTPKNGPLELSDTVYGRFEEKKKRDEAKMSVEAEEK